MIPTVSVVIPTYNRAVKVCATIDSVLAQTFTDLEVVVVDDGSSDDTAQRLARGFGDRIRYFAQPNQGVSVARNTGISESRGKWIAFLDSDDLWERDKLERQLQALEHFGQCTACYTDTRLYNNPERRTLFEMAREAYPHEGTLGVNNEILEGLVRPGGGGMLVCISSVIARADVIRETRGFDPALGFYADSDFLFRLATLTRFCYVNRPLVRFDRSPAETRHVGASKAWDRMEFILQENRVRLEKLLGASDGMPEKVQKLVRTTLGSVHSGLANCHLESGEYREARMAISRAARFDLTLNIAAKWLLAWISPRLALRAVQQRQCARNDLADIV
jgi:glycosyltransferase involved in cell wall biosynthesis